MPQVEPPRPLEVASFHEGGHAVLGHRLGDGPFAALRCPPAQTSFAKPIEDPMADLPSVLPVAAPSCRSRSRSWATGPTRTATTWRGLTLTPALHRRPRRYGRTDRGRHGACDRVAHNRLASRGAHCLRAASWPGPNVSTPMTSVGLFLVGAYREGFLTFDLAGRVVRSGGRPGAVSTPGRPGGVNRCRARALAEDFAGFIGSGPALVGAGSRAWLS